MDKKPFVSVENRRPNGTFGPGNSASPGRPKGQSMKEFAREVFLNMTPEEKKKWLKGLSPEMVWRMSEGNPHQTQDVTSQGEKIIVPIYGGSSLQEHNGDKTDFSAE